MNLKKNFAVIMTLVFASGALAGCLGDGTDDSQAGPTGEPGGSNGDASTGMPDAQGSLTQAGSSTVLPIALAWAEILAEEGIEIAPQGGGSGAGASKLCAGEIDIGDMSRMIKESEIATCKSNGIDPLVWEVAFDGLTVVTSADNDFIDHLTVEELNHIWREENPAQTWADVREGWPNEEIILYGPDSDSGTYEYFNEVILGTNCGPDGKSLCHPRDDYSPSADDNVLVRGVANSEYALGHFGYAYYVENTNTLKAVPIKEDAGSPAVSPTIETIADGSYAPLSRPIFMVTDGKPAKGSVLHAYFYFAMHEGQEYVDDVGYVPLDQKTLDEQRAWLPS